MLISDNIFASLITYRYNVLNMLLKYVKHSGFIYFNTYRLLYSRGVPLGHIGTGVAISAQGHICRTSANMT